jgi:lipopolysaccharide/colanic/teichoic acid biosynthesis glycosyltransferase
MGKFLKRLTDILASLSLIIILTPINFLVICMIYLMEGRPIFYRSMRLCGPNQVLKVHKFRSMVKDATHEKYQLEKNYMKDGYLDIPLDANVYTRIGRFLERTQLVETPQLVNVLLGQMSLIGNRPLPQKNIDLLKKKSQWSQRFDSPAGITGISQIVGKLNLSPEQRLQLEVMYSDVYQNGRVFTCDLYIIYRTVLLVLFSKALPVANAVKFMKQCGAKS